MALVALAAAFAFQQIRDFDYWWHLELGEQIAATGRVPHADPLSYSMPGAPYLDVHWLFQLALHGLHRLGGHVAVELATQVGLTFAMVGLAALAAGPSRRPTGVIPRARPAGRRDQQREGRHLGARHDAVAP